MSRGGLPDPLKIHDKGGLPDPLGIMKGSKESELFETQADQDQAAPLPKRGESGDPELQKRATEQFATREASVALQARAAGATRSDNDADLLGYAGPKKRSSEARKRLLGTR